MGLTPNDPAAPSANFGAVPAEYAGTDSRFCVIQAPYDLTTSYGGGARSGPKAIIEASANMELFDEELKCEPFVEGIRTLAPLEATAAGPERMVKMVEGLSADVIESGHVPVMLGGEHSVTLGLVRALVEKHPGLSVLQLDAHADMRDTYMDTPFSHACVARRISELVPVVQAGIRSLSAEEAGFLSSPGGAGVKTFYAKEILRGGFDPDTIAAELGPEVFITVDLDVFDPSVMPATGTPEPGGVGWYDILELLRPVFREKDVVGFDVVELSPIPGIPAPDFLAARLVYKMMGYLNQGRGG